MEETLIYFSIFDLSNVISDICEHQTELISHNLNGIKFKNIHQNLIISHYYSVTKTVQAVIFIHSSFTFDSLIIALLHINTQGVTKEK